MTAVNIFASGPVGIIASDTAAYDAQGVVQSFMGKVATIPRLRCAIAIRGAVAALAAYANDIDYRADSFDHLIEEGADFIEDTFDRQAEHMAALCYEGQIQLSVVGWSQRHRACLSFAISSMPIGDVPAFTWWHQPVIVSPMPAMEELSAAGVLAANGGFDDRDPVATMLKLVKVQRTHKARLGPAEHMPEVYTVGGDIILTEVSENGIGQRIVHSWPDRVGELIDPHPPANVVPISREQQRRLKQRRAG